MGESDYCATATRVCAPRPPPPRRTQDAAKGMRHRLACLMVCFGTSMGQVPVSSIRSQASTKVDRFLLHIFGSEENLEHTANAFFAVHDFVESSSAVREPWSAWSAIPIALRHPVELLWLRLTRILGASGRMPITARTSGPNLARPGRCVRRLCLPQPPSGFGGATHPSIFRALREEWMLKYASDSAMKQLLSGNLRSCIETGDGHYLPLYPSCTEKHTVDRFDPASDLKLDLNTPLALA